MSTTNYSGLLLINKPEGLTSHDVVYKIRKKYKTKVGHCGTLDPFASGLLVLVLGEATKVASYISSENKHYECEIELGKNSDTLDSTGECVQTTNKKDLNFSKTELLTAIKKLTGVLLLKVPIYSAIKVKGKKLYEYARQDKPVDNIPVKKMNFLDVRFVSYKDQMLKVTMKVSSGTYVRAWAKALGDELKVGEQKVGALVHRLNRNFSAPYNLDKALFLEKALSLDLSQNQDKQLWNQAFVPIDKALSNMKPVFFSSKEARLLQNGQISYSVENVLVTEQKQAQKLKKNKLYKALDHKESLLGILEISLSGKLHIKRLIKNSD